jgi:serine/threonine protein kinase
VRREQIKKEAKERARIEHERRQEKRRERELAEIRAKEQEQIRLRALHEARKEEVRIKRKRMIHQHVKEYPELSLKVREMERACENSFFLSRLEKSSTVLSRLSEINLPGRRVCMSGNDTEFRNFVSGIKLLGRGGFGTVWKANICGEEIAVKEAAFTKSELTNIKQSHGDVYLKKKSYPNEAKLMVFMNTAILGKECPNFVLTYKIGACNQCAILQEPLPVPCYTSFLELAIGDLSKFGFQDNINLASSLLYQALIGLYWMHRNGIYHGDLKCLNLLLLQTSPGGYIKYIVNDKEYLVPNCGYILLHNDFGLSQIFKPSARFQTFYGTRNARVSRSGKLEPISCNRNLLFRTTEDTYQSFNNNLQYIRWTDGQISTQNRFGNIDIEPNIPVNLEDMDEFPPQEFFVDNHELLATFTGGYSITYQSQNGIFPQLKDFPQAVVDKISRFKTPIFPYSPSAAYLLRTDLLLQKIYTPPSDPSNIRIVQSYKF